jgi:hypothetical protein
LCGGKSERKREEVNIRREDIKGKRKEETGKGTILGESEGSKDWKDNKERKGTVRTGALARQIKDQGSRIDKDK